MKLRILAWALAVVIVLQKWPSLAAEQTATQTKATKIETIAIYNCYQGLPPETMRFFKASGYNMYQRWDTGWTLWPVHLDRYYAEVTEDVRRMKQAGFKTYILFSANMRQRRVGETEGFRDDGFDPADEKLMNERLAHLTSAIRKLKTADGFTFFAGDPGGHRLANPRQFFEMTKKVIAIIAHEAPEAEINVDTWAIAAWCYFESPFRLGFWEKETQFTRELMALPDILGPRVGMEFPMHNYYRSLALKLFDEAGKKPELFPNVDEVRQLQRRGVKRLWGWPYFLTDECDDGYDPRNGGSAQSETRYIKQTVDSARRLGLNGMTANAMVPDIFAESLNLYAFARCCKDSAVTPAQIIDEFAAFISQPDTTAALATVIRYIENQSTWQAGMPASHRLPNFSAGTLKTPQDALALLATVRVRPKSTLPMCRPPADYVLKLKERLQTLTREREKVSRTVSREQEEK